jgi:hypothetical protein
MRRSVVLVLGFIMPMAIVFAVSIVMDARSAVEIHGTPNVQSGAPGMLAELSAELNRMALLIFGGAAVLFREQRRERISTSVWVTGVVALALTTGSIFAGFKYRISLAQQVAADTLDLDLISNRLALQGWLLILCLSALILMTLLVFIPKPGEAPIADVES